MSIVLFEHNRIAYEAALEMLGESGKAAVIHPTGTGKSFVGFKLCEQHPHHRIYWLSPSEYIFRTQLENLKSAADGYEPTNVTFVTYAKLMLLSDDDIADVQPDYIILDEFHRCGAEQWGKGVQRLLEAYPDTPILGLSATNIRYLDNRRDMADELFGGNVASEMTLGEAIVRGILNPPKYVLSVFSYRKQLEKYQNRINRTRNKAIRDPAQRYLDALRRTLDMADGLDEIFRKHITNTTGKYIVFCANFDHMQEMIDKAPLWFAKIDKHPHIYSVYSNDPSSSESFQTFKEDSDNNHLKLLYCIDTLNEGIHLDDICGVILLRPTVSPIIFKQQIGRALSASKKTDAVIFDIVLNIENLYSIGAIEEEMQIAASYYRSLGESEAIINEHFQVIDEIRECVALFERLNDTLTASWEIMYEYARNYYTENGDLEIPARYVTEDGYSLGKWIYNQRNIRKGLHEGKLSEARIAKLDAIGMRWELSADLSWECNYAAAEAYYRDHGDLDVYYRYVTPDGVALGTWLCSLRTWERAGVHPRYLTEERKEKLEAIGMIWDKLDYYWEQNYMVACKYYREYRNLDVPSSYVTDDGIRLGSWICRLRQLREGSCRGSPLTGEQISRLDQIGMIWKKRIDHRWQVMYGAAVDYSKANGNLSVPVTFVSEGGIKLGSWIKRQRLVFKRGKMAAARKQALDAIGMIWDTKPWLTKYNMVKEYYLENGTLDIPQSIVVDGIWIGKWIASQQKLYDKGSLTGEQRELLSQLPLEQVKRKDKAWYSMYNDAVAYARAHGSLRNVPVGYTGESGFQLADWIVRQRRKWNAGGLSDEQIRLLDEIGFVWRLESAWEEGYRHAKAYYDEHGHLCMPSAHKCSDGYALGRWVFNYRKARNGIKSPVQITEGHIEALEAIGMDWNPDTQWDINYERAKQYYIEHGSLPTELSKWQEETKAITYWLNNQRKSYRLGYLTPTKLLRLENIGITEEWLAPRQTPFEKGYAVARSYFEEHGNLDITTNYRHESGLWLGSWVNKIRKKKSELTEAQVKRLDAIGFAWEQIDEDTDNGSERIHREKSCNDA